MTKNIGKMLELNKKRTAKEEKKKEELVTNAI